MSTPVAAVALKGWRSESPVTPRPPQQAGRPGLCGHPATPQGRGTSGSQG